MLAVLLALLFAQGPDSLAEGVKALDQDKPAVAETLLRAAVLANPMDYFAHFNLGLAFSMQNKDDEAVIEFRRTLSLKPQLYEADLNLGMVLVRIKAFGEALPVLKEAVDAKPTEPVPNFYYAQALLETGGIADAKAHFQAGPPSPRNTYGLGRCYLKEGNLPEAEKALRAAAAQDVDFRNGLLDLAAEYEKARKFPEAIAIYKEFPEKPEAKQRISEIEQFAKASDPFEVHMAKGRELRDSRLFIPAANEFLAAAKIHPDSLPAWKELAAVLVINKNFPEALTALDHAKALGPETPGQLYYRAISLDSLKQKKPAIAAYQQFLAHSGGTLPDQEFLARQRIRIIESDLKR
jgi:tetratricopeptide (TPR) repeat protein